MTSLIASGMMLTWYRTQRFVELLQKNLTFLSLAQKLAHTHLMLTLFSHHVQNIKKLLKIPYSKSHVSMAVHRVGRTLLLDELDIQELFMRSSQVRHSLLQTFIRYVCH